jgi:lactate dehydrogenase-like 2-hydroxyacid dehydrogenase
MKKRVLVTYNMFRAGYAELIEKYDVTFPPEGRETFTYDEVFEMIPEYDVLQSMFNFPVDRKLMERGKPRLELVSNYAVGFDNIDVPAATELGITITNTPDPVTEPTADLAMGLMLAVARRIADVDKRLRIPDALRWGLMENLGYSLYGKTLGIIGMGRIGQALAKRAIASGMHIIYNNRHRLEPAIESLYKATYVSKSELIQQADVISINAPHFKETTHLIGAAELEQMKPTAILINTARGPLVDELALAKALKEHRIYGAGLDVFEFGDRVSQAILDCDNAVVTPHLGTQTYDVRNEMAEYVSRNIINFYEGGSVARVN